MAVDEDELQAFLNRAVGDLGASMSAMLVLIGDELGLYAALADRALDPARNWPSAPAPSSATCASGWPNRAAGGYVEYDNATGTYFLNEVQALCLADPDGPVDPPGGYSVVEDLFHVKSRAVQNFGPARAWSGAITIRACSVGRSASSGAG